MSRLLRLPPLVRAPLTAVSLVLLLAGGVPVAAFPFLAADAGAYRQAIGVHSSECAKDPVPTAGNCWSAAPARVTITGVDQLESGAVAYLVLQVAGREPVREDLLGGALPKDVELGTKLTVRYWHSDIAEVVTASQTLPTRDNPAYRAAHFPGADAAVVVFAILGLIAFGVPLYGDVQEWRRRKRLDSELDTAPGALRGLARYGMTLEPAPTEVPETPPAAEATLTGENAWPAKPDVVPGGAGWNIRAS